MRCLLAADLDRPSDALRHVMGRLEVDLVGVDHLGVDWLTEAPTPPVDFVCAVLHAYENADAEAAVFVDIGVALGRRIPVFLIVEPSRRTPLVVAGLTRVEAHLTNEEALELHLRQFLRTIRRGQPNDPAVADGRVLSPIDAELAHERLAAVLKSHNAGHKFEQAIFDVLSAVDAEVSTYRGSYDGGHDLALWARGAISVLDGPVPIQLKLWDRPSPREIKRAINLFFGQLRGQSAPFGLFIYHSPLGGYSFSVPGGSPETSVVAISAHELVDLLREQSLSRLLISMRNAVMHGVSYRG